MTLQQQDAIWPAVQKIWATRNHRLITRRLAELLQISGQHRAAKITWGGLDLTQSREAFFARLAQMRKI